VRPFFGAVVAVVVLALLPRAAAAEEPSPDARLERLEARVDEREARRAPDELRILHMSGYLQPQLVVPLAPGRTVALADGTTTNETLVRLRRARLKAEVTPSDYAQLTIEIEPLPKGARVPQAGTFARNVEAIGIARVSDDTRFELAMGQFNLPFGSEIMESNAGRPFIDSSFAMGAMFPGDFDIGARGMFVHRGLTMMASVVNGVMLGEPTFALSPDFDGTKDLTLRADYDFGPLDVGVSAYLGKGSRTDTPRLAFASWRRSAWNAEATLHHPALPKLGDTKIVFGATLGTNMDRGVAYSFTLPDFPRAPGGPIADKRQLGAVVRVEQDATRWITLGVRYDYYTPELDVADDGRSAFAAVGVVHFTRFLQTMLEYDVAFDHVHPAAAPTARNVTDTLSAVFQARF
jgi:hypothetical protein